ncbi:MAG: bacterial proteasome activator family protein [Actinobacteria bacterium]|nr:bacterial proteasome activator family protein [Actinomycetota bacterium]
MTSIEDTEPNGGAGNHVGGAPEPVEVVNPRGGAGVQAGEEPPPMETIDQPAKVMRIGAMIKQLLDEVHHAPLDVEGRERLREIYEVSIKELSEGLSPDLRGELSRLALPFGEETPSEAELRVAKAQLVGWLEGLFHGIQATLFAQQMVARQQLEEMQQRGLASGSAPQGQGDGHRPGTYL